MISCNLVGRQSIHVIPREFWCDAFYRNNIEKHTGKMCRDDFQPVVVG